MSRLYYKSTGRGIWRLNVLFGKEKTIPVFSVELSYWHWQCVLNIKRIQTRTSSTVPLDRWQSYPTWAFRSCTNHQLTNLRSEAWIIGESALPATLLQRIATPTSCCGQFWLDGGLESQRHWLDSLKLPRQLDGQLQNTKIGLSHRLRIQRIAASEVHPNSAGTDNHTNMKEWSIEENVLCYLPGQA